MVAFLATYVSKQCVSASTPAAEVTLGGAVIVSSGSTTATFGIKCVLTIANFT